MPAPVVPLEIWLADISWGHADDPRPVVFAGLRPNSVYVVFRVSSSDLFGQDDFVIEDTHADFAGTRLARTSYVEAQMQELQEDRFVHQLGTLSGGLQVAFVQWQKSGVVRP